jgi:hypothetical protein
MDGMKMRAINDTRLLARFKLEITSGQPRIYRNGRQQLKIVVTYQPAKNITLTEEQLASLRLVVAEGGDYQELSPEFSVSTVRDEQFAYFRGGQSRPRRAADIETNNESKTFYVSSTHEAGVPIKLCAAINKNDDEVYVSDTSNFNSSVEIQTVEPDHASREHFIFTGHDIYFEDLSEHTGLLQIPHKKLLDGDIYKLKFKHPNKLIRSHAAEESEAGDGALWYSARHDEGFWSGEHAYLHAAYSVNSDIQYNVGNLYIPMSEKNTMMFSRTKWYYDSSMYVKDIEPIKKRSVWILLDHFGNTHKIEMFTKASGNIPDFKILDEHYGEA